MKKSLIIAVLATLPLSPSLVLADDAHHPDKTKKPAAPVDHEKPMQMGKMQDAMMKMHEQMHKIMDAKTPQEREQYKQEHAKMMQEHMQMMQGMMGGKMGHGKMGGDTKGGKMDGTM